MWSHRLENRWIFRVMNGWHVQWSFLCECIMTLWNRCVCMRPRIRLFMSGTRIWQAIHVANSQKSSNSYWIYPRLKGPTALPVSIRSPNLRSLRSPRQRRYPVFRGSRTYWVTFSSSLDMLIILKKAINSKPSTSQTFLTGICQNMVSLKP